MSNAKQDSLNQVLEGKTIVVTRSQKQAHDLIQLIEEKGGIAYPFPVVETRWVDNLEPLDCALQQLEEYDWIIFTSVNTIHYFYERIESLGLTAQARATLKAKKIAAIGPKTAQAIEQRGLTVALMPQSFQQEGLFEAIQAKAAPGMKILYPRAEVARRELGEQLRRIGVEVDEVPVYQTVMVAQDIKDFLDKLGESAIDVITFTSSSTVKHFVMLLEGTPWKDYLDQLIIACIGPITAQTAREQGLSVKIVAQTYTAEALLNEIEQYYQNKREV